MDSEKICPDCGVKPGELHEWGCDVERCPFCGGQSIGCGCGLHLIEDRFGEGSSKGKLTDEMVRVWSAVLEREGRLPWTGRWPGSDEASRRGWWARLVEGQGWVRCGKGDEGAKEDLNRVYEELMWSCEARAFVEREER